MAVVAKVDKAVHVFEVAACDLVRLKPNRDRAEM